MTSDITQRGDAPWGNVSFDDHVLSHVMEAGAHVIHQPVWEVRLPLQPNGRVRLTYGTREAPSTFEADLVVGAFGLDSALIHQMERLGFGYHPPQTRRACQAELEVGNPYVRQRLGDRILLLCLGIEAIRFATIIPKSSHITVSLMWRTACSECAVGHVHGGCTLSDDSLFGTESDDPDAVLRQYAERIPGTASGLKHRQYPEKNKRRRDRCVRQREGSRPTPYALRDVLCGEKWTAPEGDREE